MSEEYDPFQPTEEDDYSSKFRSSKSSRKAKKKQQPPRDVVMGVELSMIQLPPEPPAKTAKPASANEKARKSSSGGEGSIVHASDKKPSDGLIPQGVPPAAPLPTVSHQEEAGSTAEKTKTTAHGGIDSDHTNPPPPSLTVIASAEDKKAVIGQPPKKAATLIAMATARATAPPDQSVKKKFGFGSLSKSPTGPAAYATQKPEPKTLSKISFALKKPRFRPLAQFSEPEPGSETKDTTEAGQEGAAAPVVTNPAPTQSTTENTSVDSSLSIPVAQKTSASINMAGSKQCDERPRSNSHSATEISDEKRSDSHGHEHRHSPKGKSRHIELEKPSEKRDRDVTDEKHEGKRPGRIDKEFTDREKRDETEKLEKDRKSSKSSEVTKEGNERDKKSRHSSKRKSRFSDDPNPSKSQFGMGSKTEEPESSLLKKEFTDKKPDIISTESSGTGHSLERISRFSSSETTHKETKGTKVEEDDVFPLRKEKVEQKTEETGTNTLKQGQKDSSGDSFNDIGVYTPPRSVCLTRKEIKPHPIETDTHRRSLKPKISSGFSFIAEAFGDVEKKIQEELKDPDIGKFSNSLAMVNQNVVVGERSDKPAVKTESALDRKEKISNEAIDRECLTVNTSQETVLEPAVVVESATRTRSNSPTLVLSGRKIRLKRSKWDVTERGSEQYSPTLGEATKSDGDPLKSSAKIEDVVMKGNDKADKTTNDKVRMTKKEELIVTEKNNSEEVVEKNDSDFLQENEALEKKEQEVDQKKDTKLDNQPEKIDISPLKSQSEIPEVTQSEGNKLNKNEGNISIPVTSKQADNNSENVSSREMEAAEQSKPVEKMENNSESVSSSKTGTVEQAKPAEEMAVDGSQSSSSSSEDSSGSSSSGDSSDGTSSESSSDSSESESEDTSEKNVEEEKVMETGETAVTNTIDGQTPKADTEAVEMFQVEEDAGKSESLPVHIDPGTTDSDKAQPSGIQAKKEEPVREEPKNEKTATTVEETNTDTKTDEEDKHVEQSATMGDKHLVETPTIEQSSHNNHDKATLEAAERVTSSDKTSDAVSSVPDRRKERSNSRSKRHRRSRSRDRKRDRSRESRSRDSRRREGSPPRKKDRSPSRDRRRGSREYRRERSMSRDRRRSSTTRDRRTDRSSSRDRRKDGSGSRDRKTRPGSQERRKERSTSRDRRRDGSLSRERRMNRSGSRDRRKDRSLSRERRMDVNRRRGRSPSRERRRERRSLSRERRRTPPRRRRSRDRSSSYDRSNKRRRSRSRDRRSLSRNRRSRSRGRRSRSRDRHSKSTRRRYSSDRRMSPDRRERERSREYEKKSGHSSHGRGQRSPSAEGTRGKVNASTREDAAKRKISSLSVPAIGIPLPAEAFSTFASGKIPPPPPPPMGVSLGPPLPSISSEPEKMHGRDIGDTVTSSAYGTESSSIDKVSSTTSDKVVTTTNRVENVQTIQVLGGGRSSGNFPSQTASAGTAPARSFPSTLQETHKPLSFSISMGQRKPFVGKKKSLHIFDEDSNESENMDDIDEVITLPRMDISPTLHAARGDEPSNLISIPTSHNDIDKSTGFHVDSSSNVKNDYYNAPKSSNLINVVLSHPSDKSANDWGVDSSTEKFTKTTISETGVLNSNQVSNAVTPSPIPTLIGGKAGAPSPEKHFGHSLPPSEVSSTSNEPFLPGTEESEYQIVSNSGVLSALPSVGSILPPKPQRVVSQESIADANVPSPSSIETLTKPLPARKRKYFREYDVESTYATSEQLDYASSGQGSFGFDAKQSTLDKTSPNRLESDTSTEVVNTEPEYIGKKQTEPVTGKDVVKTLLDFARLNQSTPVGSKGVEEPVLDSVSSMATDHRRDVTQHSGKVMDSGADQSEPDKTGFDLFMGSVDEEPLLQEPYEDKKSTLSHELVAVDGHSRANQDSKRSQQTDQKPAEEEEGDAKPCKRSSRRKSLRKSQQVEPLAPHEEEDAAAGASALDDAENVPPPDGGGVGGIQTRRRSSRLKNLEQQGKDTMTTEVKSKDEKSNKGNGRRGKKRRDEDGTMPDTPSPVEAESGAQAVDNETEPPPPPPPPPPSGVPGQTDGESDYLVTNTGITIKQVLDTKEEFILPENVPLRGDDTPTSSNGALSTAGLSPGSAGSSGKPEKVKSRWRRWSELETKVVEPLSTVQEDIPPPPPPPPPAPREDVTPPAGAEVNQGDEVIVSGIKQEPTAETDTSADAPPPPPPPPPSQVSASVKEDELKQEVDGIKPELVTPKEEEPVEAKPPPEKPPYFEPILDHIFLYERKKSKARKEARRMVCDCTPPGKEDRVFSGAVACGEDCLNRMLMIECGSRCPCGDMCTNKRFQKHQYADVDTFYAGTKGWGMQAKSDIPVGTFLMEYVGEVLDFAEFQNRAKSYSTNEHFYFMALNSDEIVDATRKGNISRFINHSCDPMAETQKWTVNGQLRIGFFTVKDVAAGEEITFDYQFENYGQEAQKCYCGATNCRGYLGTKKTRLQDEMEDEVFTEVGTERRKRKKDKKKRPRIFDDVLLSEEIQQMIELDGMRRRDNVLEFARLMVRAENAEHRADLLKVLQVTKEPNCLRLFLDYQGLSLLWSWMVDVSRNAFQLKMQILQTLKILPITNKTILKDSKILSMVQKWAGLTPGQGDRKESVFTESGGSHTPRSASEAEKDEPLTPTTPVTPGSLSASSQSEGSVFLHKKRRLLQSLHSTMEEASGSDSDMSEAKAKGEGEGDISCSEDKSADLSQDGSDTGLLGTSAGGNQGNNEEMSNAVIELAEELLNLWKDLKESFKIPKIKVEERKKRERELDKERGYSKGHSRFSRGHRDSRKRQGGSSPDRSREEKRRRDSDRESLDSRIRKVLQPTPPKGPKMSKEEHRKLFELQVKAEDTLKKQAELEQQQQIELQQQYYQQQQQQQQDPAFAAYYQQQQAQTATVPAYQDSSLYPDPSYAAYDPNTAAYTQDQSQYILQADGTYITVAQPTATTEQQSGSVVIDPVTLQPVQPSVASTTPYLGSESQYMDPATQQVLQSYQQSYVTPENTVDPLSSQSDLYTVQQQPQTPSAQNAAVGATQQQQQTQVLQMVQGTGQAPVQQVYYTTQQGQMIVQQPLVNQIVQQVPGQQAQVITVTDPTAIQQINDATSLLLMNEKLAQIAPVATNDVTSTTATVSRDPRDPPPPPPSPPPKPKTIRLPPNWKTAKDAEGKAYYYHTVTRQTQWDPPPWDQGEDDDDKMDFGTPTYDENEPKNGKRKRKSKQVSVKHLSGRLHTKKKKKLHSKQHLVKKKKETNTASADSSSEIAKKIKDQFRTKMSKYVVTYLNPYRKPECKKGRISNHDEFKHLARKMSKHMVKYLSPYRKPECKLGRVTTTDDFKHLARKLTHAVLDKELKYCRHVEDLEVNESVKSKAKEFVKKYMSRFGTIYKSKGDDSPP